MFLIDIIFQSGEFYSPESSFISDLAINAVGALIGVLGALYIFRLQLRHDRRKEAEKDANVIENRLHYLANAVDKVLRVSRVNAIHIKEFCKEIHEKSIDFPAIKAMPNLDYKRFTESINHEEYYQAYILKYGRNSTTVEEFRSIYSLVDYLYLQVEQVLSSYSAAREKYEDKRKKFEHLINNTRHATTSYINSLPENKDDEYLQECMLELVKESNIIIGKFKAGPEEVNEVWVKPLLEGLLPHFSDNKFLSAVKEDLSRCMNIPTELKHFNATVKNEFERVHFKMLVAIDDLSKASDRINKEYAPLPAAEEIEAILK